REAAARTVCQHNLAQLGRASHNFDNFHGKLPPGIGWFSGTAYEGAYGTGFFHLLPFVEQDTLYKSAWNGAGGFFDATMNQVFSRPIPVFVCPSDFSSAGGVVNDAGGTPSAAGTYAGNAHVFCLTNAVTGKLISPQNFASISRSFGDGTSATILFAEHYARCTNDAYPEGGSLWAYSMTGRAARPLHPGFA